MKDERGFMRGIKRGVKWMAHLLLTLSLVGACIYVDARYIEPKLLKVNHLEIETKKIKKPLRIVQFTDTHLGEYYTESDLGKLVNKINSLSPDLIIFTGDLMDDHRMVSDEQGIIKKLQELKSRYGKYSIYGNHDHGSNGTKKYARMMKESHFILLKNSHEELVLDDGSLLSIIGIDDMVLSKPNLEQAFQGTKSSSFKLFLSHAPDIANEASLYGADLQLSGHTHGGQIRLPFIGALWTPFYGKEYVKGLYTVGSNEMKLYVNTGVGMSQVPFRLLNPPEITVIDLVKYRGMA